MIDIVVDNVTFSYSPQVTALREISVTIKSGETVAIIGENGAGKSTLVKHFNGLLHPTEGRVSVGGWDTRDFSAAQLAHRVAFAFQNPDDQLFKRSVAAEVAFGPEQLGYSEEEVRLAVNSALQITGLGDQAQTHLHDLPHAQRRMVALAATLALNAPVIVIDEPTIGQDAGGIRRLEEIIARLNADGRTVIAISHNIDFCANNFGRILLMSRGRIIADGPSPEVFSKKELLAQAHVEPPQIVRLAEALNLPENVIDLESFMQVLRKKRN